MEDRGHSSRLRWALWGAAFGFCFPVLASVIRIAQLGAAGTWLAFSEDPLLWIIATAPAFLGGFALVGGIQHDHVRGLTRGLERRVAERTAQLRAVLDRVEVILNNAGDGFATIDAQGALVGAPSAAALTWFGSPSQDSATPWLFPDAAGQGALFELGLEQIAEDSLPFELIADQMPRRFSRMGSQFEIEYRQLRSDGQDGGILLVIRDVTAREAAAVAEQRRNEQQEVVAHLLGQTAAFVRFCRDGVSLVDKICGHTDAVERARALHTLKGNAGLVGYSSLARACHLLEDDLATAQSIWSAEFSLRLRRAWDDCMELVADFKALTRDDIRVPRAQFDTYVRSLATGDHASREVGLSLRHWQQAALGPILEGLREHAVRLAVRLGRKIEVRITHRDIRVDDERTADVWASMVHLVRNAVDHGIEDPQDRIAAGKPEVGVLELDAREDATGITISVRDDGRGIDWQILRAHAATLGVPESVLSDPVALIFTDGLSSRSAVSETSGRGVGLGALLAAVGQLDGSITVHSPAQAASTEFSWRIPHQLGPQAQAEGRVHAAETEMQPPAKARSVAV